MRLACLLFLASAAYANAEGSVAFFGISLHDSSLQSSVSGEDSAEVARVSMLERIIEQRFAAEGYELLDLAPVQEELDGVANPAKCYGCDIRMAADLGADYSLVGEVQKVSNLILAMNLQLRDVETGQLVRGGVVDIRGNTDESWERGMRYMLKNRIFVGE